MTANQTFHFGAFNPLVLNGQCTVVLTRWNPKFVRRINADDTCWIRESADIRTGKPHVAQFQFIQRPYPVWTQLLPDTAFGKTGMRWLYSERQAVHNPYDIPAELMKSCLTWLDYFKLLRLANLRRVWVEVKLT